MHLGLKLKLVRIGTHPPLLTRIKYGSAYVPPRLRNLA
ncbi:MAG: hypothetical protein QOK24_236 [Verrucomicrobiota bacterium]